MLKPIVCIALLTSGISAFAGVANLQIANRDRVSDCKSVNDVGQIGYQASNVSFNLTTSSIDVDLKLNCLQCAKTSAGYAWVPHYFTDPTPYLDLDGQPAIKYIDNPEFVLVNQELDVVGTTPAQDSTYQNLHYSVPLTSAITPEQMFALTKGQTISLRWEFFQRGEGRIQTGTQMIQIGEVSGGAYNFLFDLSFK